MSSCQCEDSASTRRVGGVEVCTCCGLPPAPVAICKCHACEQVKELDDLIKYEGNLFCRDCAPVLHEGYPAGWVKVILMVSPEGGMNAIGGDRKEGEGDMPFIGLERIKARLVDARKLRQLLHSMCKHPDYQYETIDFALGHHILTPPTEDDGWVLNRAKDEGSKTFKYHEEVYWMRRIENKLLYLMNSRSGIHEHD